MAKFSLTRKAIEDLSEIWDYTFQTWSESQADKYYKLLIGTCHEISRNPEKGRNYNEISDGLLGIRIGKHIIFYSRIGNKEIEVIRILHERMDLRNRLLD